MSENIVSDSACVYLSYESVPEHPGEDWTRFICISDTHSATLPVPSGDVLLHAGDLSSYGENEQLEVTLQWLKSLPHPTKIIIAGNHDLCLDAKLHRNLAAIQDGDESSRIAQDAMKSKDCQDAGIYYLQDESMILRTWSSEFKVYGTPASPRYARGAFQYSNKAEAEGIYSRIPRDTQILLTHTPPYRTNDRSRKGTSAGCRVLAERVQRLKECRLHVFGHIHEAWGASQAQIGRTLRTSVNAAVPHASHVVIVDLKNRVD